MTDPSPDPAPTEAYGPPELETRGLRGILVCAGIGLVVGAVVGAVWSVHLFHDLWAAERPWLVGLLDGGLAGVIVGGVVGALLWALFPYKHPPPQSPEG